MPVTEFDRACLADVGVRDVDSETTARAMHRGRGIIYVCGPPGSGRRRAMQALLKCVNHEAHHVVSLEQLAEPVPRGVSQIPRSGQPSLPKVLRTLMSADTDVLMLEWPDDAAEAACLVRAAGGMVVIAGVPVSSSLAPLLSLAEMGMPVPLVCQLVTCVVSTRTVPRLCRHCRQPAPVPLELLTAFPPLQEAALSFTASEAAGCNACNGTGRDGSVSLYAVHEIGPQLGAVLGGPYQPSALADAGLKATVMAVLADALHKSQAGLLDLHDLTPVIDECPPTAPFVKFWEG